MILQPQDLPSQGKLEPDGAPIRFRPFTFLEILEYSEEVTGNPIKDYLKDIQWLLKQDKNILNHSLYDLDYLIFMMKGHTITEDKEFHSELECSGCGEKSLLTFNMSEFRFDSLELEDLAERVVLDGYKYKIKIPTIGVFYKILKTYSIYMKTNKVEIVKLISLFPEFETMPNDVEKAVTSASRTDISVLYTLITKYLSPVEPIERDCPICEKKRGMVVGIGSLITDLFRDVLLNNQPSGTEIQFREVRKDK